MKKIHPYSAVDIVTLKFRDKKLFVYLVEVTNKLFHGNWALPGALVREFETLEDAAERIYNESTGRTPVFLEQIFTFSDPERDPRSRSISTAYFAFPEKTQENFTVFCPKYSNGKWWDVKKVPELGYDHNQILRVAVERIVGKLNYTTIGLSLLPKEFTLTELQDLYEYFAEKPIDKRNFRSKILSLNVIKETGRYQAGGQFRPAKLYSAVKKGVQIIPLF